MEEQRKERRTKKLKKSRLIEKDQSWPIIMAMEEPNKQIMKIMGRKCRQQTEKRNKQQVDRRTRKKCEFIRGEDIRDEWSEWFAVKIDRNPIIWAHNKGRWRAHTFRSINLKRKQIFSPDAFSSSQNHQLATGLSSNRTIVQRRKCRLMKRTSVCNLERTAFWPKSLDKVFGRPLLVTRVLEDPEKLFSLVFLASKSGPIRTTKSVPSPKKARRKVFIWFKLEESGRCANLWKDLETIWWHQQVANDLNVDRLNCQTVLFKCAYMYVRANRPLRKQMRRRQTWKKKHFLPVSCRTEKRALNEEVEGQNAVRMPVDEEKRTRWCKAHAKCIHETFENWMNYRRVQMTVLATSHLLICLFYTKVAVWWSIERKDACLRPNQGKTAEHLPKSKRLEKRFLQWMQMKSRGSYAECKCVCVCVYFFADPSQGQQMEEVGHSLYFDLLSDLIELASCWTAEKCTQVMCVCVCVCRQHIDLIPFGCW